MMVARHVLQGFDPSHLAVLNIYLAGRTVLYSDNLPACPCPADRAPIFGVEQCRVDKRGDNAEHVCR